MDYSLSDEQLRFRKFVHDFVAKEVKPQAKDVDEKAEFNWPAVRKMGPIGLLGLEVPERYGGAEVDAVSAAIAVEQLGWGCGSTALAVAAHNGLALGPIVQFGSEEQKQRWLPDLATGRGKLACLGLTEPGAGSDVQGIASKARRDGDSYVLNGSKTFVTNAALAGLVCVAVRTDTSARGWQGISLVFVEPKGLQGCRVGRPLAKVGMHGQDTCEIFFDDVRIPASSLLGPREGIGFSQMMERLPYERLLVGASGVASSERAVELTVQHAKDRKAYGKRLLDLQTTRATLADCQTRTRIGRVFLDSCVQRFIAGQSDDVTAAMAKYWLTESQFRTIDACLQIFGGYGYMEEYAIARMWADSRVQRIYGGANEVMQEIVAWSL